MNSPVLVPVVEGHSEVQSVPVLLRRLLTEWSQHYVQVARPVRVGRYKVVQPGELERTFELARPEGCDAILLLLDADDDCPKELAPNLLARAREAAADLPTTVVLAKPELEAWFVGSLESLRGVRGLSDTATSPEHPEEIRDAKRHLTRQMTEGRTYVEVDDQPALAAKFDWRLARQRCPSLDKFIRDLETLLASFRQ